MKILKNDRDGNKVKLEIEESAEEYQKSIKKTIDEAARDMKLPGFRKGKAPRAMVEKNLNQKAIDDHAGQQLISKLYPKIIEETKIDPVDYPKVDIIQLEQGKEVKFSIEVEVYPEVNLGNYKGISVEKKSSEVKEEDVLKVLGDLQNRLAKWKEVTDRPVKGDDVLDIEIEAHAEGTEIKTWPRDLQHYPVGSKYISKEFDDQLVGLEINIEKEFQTKFADDYAVKEIAGKDVTFKVKVAKINEKELADLSDEFAKQISKYGTLGELKAELTKNLEEEKKQESEGDLKNKLVEEVSKESDIDIPRSMVDAEIQIMMDELKTSLARSNITPENYLKSIGKTEEDLISEFIQPATSRVKGKIVLKAIAEKENIEVEDKDLDEEIAPMAQQEKKSVEEYKKLLRENSLMYIKDYLKRRKALDFLQEHAKIKEIKEKEAQ
ncbi:MAG: trigger factor [Candidatus Saganbacteria bacterium]|nr:trigger factor [Candidatus Saganbacteria bacterium]